DGDRRQRRPGADPVRPEAARAPARVADRPDHTDLPVARAARAAALPRSLPDPLRRAPPVPPALRRPRARGPPAGGGARVPGAARRAGPDRQEPLMASVLVTHADLPLGRRVVKVLWHDPAVQRVFALGEGPVPRAFGTYRVGTSPRLVYERIDLARQRTVA